MSWKSFFNSEKWPMHWESSRFERKKDAENLLKAMIENRKDIINSGVVKSKWRPEITAKMIEGQESEVNI